MRKKHFLKTPMLLLALTMANQAFAKIPDAPDVKAKSYVLMEYSTGKILNDLNPDEKLAPASLTKVMSAYVVFNELQSGRLSLDDEIKISKKAWKTQGSKTYVRVDTKVKVRDLITGMIVQSGNDATIALAEHIAGSESEFAELMNYQAKKLGMTNSHFKNVTGLPIRGHYTTARDLAKLTKAIIHDFPEYYYIFHLKQFTYSNITQHNRNKLLTEDLGFDGLKTGFTNKAGYCYIGSSKREDTRMIVTLLGEPSPSQRFKDAKTLVNYAFRFYETHEILSKDKAIGELTTNVIKGKTDKLYVGAKDDVKVVLEKGQFDKVTYDVKMIDFATAPIDKGLNVGKITVSLNGKEIGSSDLVAMNSVEEGSFFKQMKDMIKAKFQ